MSITKEQVKFVAEAKRFSEMAATYSEQHGVTRREALRVIHRRHPEARSAFKKAGRVKFPNGLL